MGAGHIYHKDEDGNIWTILEMLKNVFANKKEDD